MSERLLREYLSLVVEKIRTQKGVKGALGKHFDINYFKKLENVQVMLGYAEKFLTKLGEGSSRSAFLLSSRYALKIATNEKGLAQNKAEVEVYSNPKSKPIVSKIYSSNDQHMWLIADLVKPIDSIEEFKDLTGVAWIDEFGRWVADGLANRQAAPNAPPFAKAVIETALENKLMFADLAQIDFNEGVSKNLLGHWGKTPDGRAVLLDYGYTEGVWRSHYKKPSQKAKPVDKKKVDVELSEPFNKMTGRKDPAHPSIVDNGTNVDRPQLKRKTLSRTLKNG